MVIKRKFPLRRPRVVSAPVERPAPRRRTAEEIESFVAIHSTVDPIEAVNIGRWMRGEIRLDQIERTEAAEAV